MTNEEKLKRRVDELTLLANKFRDTLHEVFYKGLVPSLASAHVQRDNYTANILADLIYSSKVVLQRYYDVVTAKSREWQIDKAES